MPGRGGFRRGSGRKAMWQDRETQTIRVPVAIKEQLLDIGRGLDRGQEFYDGETCAELQGVIQTWEAKCQGNDSPEWQPVRQLLAEIQSVLLRRPVRARRRGRFGHGHCHASWESERSLDD
jgi:hypothetical protein